jgi:predicted Zn-dependent protease
MSSKKCLVSYTVIALILSAAGYAARRPGAPLKPGFNLFSKEQDVQLGDANAKQVSAQYPVADNQFLQDYVRHLGGRLAAAPDAKQSGFEFRFTVLNVNDVNAFALPGGHMFIYSGLLKACDNEAQLAGVMGHEMSHVILRHGTHEASKANLIELPALLVGSLIGDDTVTGKLARMGLGLGTNSFILKFSRDAESEADALGAHLMSEVGYDPVEMARFFEKLAAGPHPPQILSDHPNPGNREKAIRAEMQTLPARSYGYQTGEFQRMKSEVAALPPAPSVPRNQ